MADGRKGFFSRAFGGRAAPDEAEAAADSAEAPASAELESADTKAEVPPAADAGSTAEVVREDTGAPEENAKTGWLNRLRSGLGRSSNVLTGSISSIFTKRRLDEETLEEFEEALIRADLGVDVASTITNELRRERIGRELGEDDVKSVLAAELEKALAPVASPLTLDTELKPSVILVVGVNGTGKTTTIGKLAAKYVADGRHVMLAAGDTFRAAAIDQLKIWGDRVGAPVEAGEVGADAAGLAFDALARAKAEGADVLLVDTAGRLQNKTELMAELEKIVRVMRKQDPAAPHHVLLTLDATTGQNALSQVETFTKIAGVTGLVMTKLDGTARGGILVAVASRFGLPVHFIGVGEGIDDLEPFNAADFARAIAGLS
ncbi:MAG: signal recognition particle-docking protein FtsY [Alphaproteobacteria bacterium]